MYPRELRARAVRLVQEHRSEYPSEWIAIQSIAAKLGVSVPETLRKWVRRAEFDPDVAHGPRARVAPAERVRELEQENRELRRANEILKAAAAVFARELDPPPPTR